FARGISTRLTSEGNEMNAAWSPDGRRITYITGFRAASSIYEVPADSSGPPQLLLKGAKMLHIDWSPDRRLVFTSVTGPPHVKIYSPVDNSVTDTGVRGAETRFSPNGRWIATVGVSVVPFPGPGGAFRSPMALRTSPFGAAMGTNSSSLRLTRQ